MSFLHFLQGNDINAGVEQWQNTAGAVLLDVRTRQEYRQGHIHGSINLPLDEIGSAGRYVPQKETPLFVHCLSGGRSGQAVRYLKQMGYQNVHNIGGIQNYHGKVER